MAKTQIAYDVVGCGVLVGVTHRHSNVIDQFDTLENAKAAAKKGKPMTRKGFVQCWDHRCWRDAAELEEARLAGEMDPEEDHCRIAEMIGDEDPASDRVAKFYFGIDKLPAAKAA